MIPEAERDPSHRDENKKSALPPDSGARRVMQRTAERNQRENEATKNIATLTNRQSNFVANSCGLQVSRVPATCPPSGMYVLSSTWSSFLALPSFLSLSLSLSLSRLPLSSPFFLRFFLVHRSFFIIHCRCVFFFQFCDVVTVAICNHHPQEERAKFGYMSERIVDIFTSMFWPPPRTQCLNMVTSNIFITF